MLEKIISGGQTGADRAALDACLETGFACGGFCPAGRRAEDGPIAEYYPLTELDGGYKQRTRKNVEVADSTVIFFHQHPTGGTALTVSYAREAGKPYLLVDTETTHLSQASVILSSFIMQHDIRVLNVAGPRLSGDPAIYDYVRTVIRNVIQTDADPAWEK
jgi:hypothetical protein